MTLKIETSPKVFSLDLLPNEKQQPDEIWKIIFSYLDFQDQTHISLVCRHWRTLVMNSSLAFGKTFAVMKMALSVPTKETCLTPTTSENIYFYGANSQYILVSRDIPHTSIDVIHKISNKVLRVELIESLSNEERKSDSLKIQYLADATWLSEDSFATVTNCSTVAWWKIAYNEEVACMAHLHIFDEAERQRSQRADLFDSFWINKMASLTQSHHLYVKGNKGEPSHADFVEVLSFDSQKHQSTLTKVCTLLQDSDHFFSFDMHDAQRLFYSMDRQYHLKCILPTPTDSSPSQTLFDIPISSIFRSGMTRTLPIAANERWAVAATYHDRSKEVAHFHVFKAQTGEKVFEFVQPFDLGGFMVKSFCITTCNWLCGDFIIMWIGQKLAIWHILTRQHLTTFDLQPLFERDHFYDPAHPRNPILHVELEDQCLHVFLHHRKQNDLHRIQFKLEQADNSKAVAYAKQNSFPGIKNYQSHLFSNLMFVASKIFQLFQAFLRLIVKIKSCLAF